MTRTRRPAALPDVDYPAGHFTALVRQHDWPPRFQSAATVDRSLTSQTAGTRRMLAAGKGFASVTLGLPGACEHIQRWRTDRDARVARPVAP